MSQSRHGYPQGRQIVPELEVTDSPESGSRGGPIGPGGTGPPENAAECRRASALKDGRKLLVTLRSREFECGRIAGLIPEESQELGLDYGAKIWPKTLFAALKREFHDAANMIETLTSEGVLWD